MFVRNTECFTVHAGFFVHLDSSFGLFRVDVALFSFGEVVSFDREFSLVEEDFID